MMIYNKILIYYFFEFYFKSKVIYLNFKFIYIINNINE